jgi:hypothetical protein
MYRLFDPRFVILVQHERMLKIEGFSCFDYGGEAAVLAGGYYLARLELYWGAAV